MALPSTFYIRHDRGSDVIKLTDITSMSRGYAWIYREVYRDEITSGGNQISITAATSPLTFNTDKIDAYGVEGGTPVYGSSFAGLRYRNSDEVNHVPWRFKKELHSGYYFGWSGTVLPTALEPEYYSSEFTVNAANNTVSFIPTVGDVYHGDLVSVASTGTLPSGLSASVTYKLLLIDKASGIQLLQNTDTNAIVDITTTGSGTHYITLVSSSRTPNFNDNMLFIPDFWNPRISNAA